MFQEARGCSLVVVCVCVSCGVGECFLVRCVPVMVAAEEEGARAKRGRGGVRVGSTFLAPAFLIASMTA